MLSQSHGIQFHNGVVSIFIMDYVFDLVQCALQCAVNVALNSCFIMWIHITHVKPSACNVCLYDAFD